VRWSAVAAAVAAVPLLAGCNTSPGAAALVGGERISIATLQHTVNRELADPDIKSALANPQFSAGLGRNAAGFVRVTLARLISERVIGRLAAEHHVTVSAQEVQSQTASFVQQVGSLQSLQTQAAEQVGVTPAELPALIRFTVLQQKLSNALVASQPITRAQLVAQYNRDIDQFDQLDLAQIAVPTKSLADRVLRKARAHPASFAALARKYSTDTQSKANGGDIGFVGRNQVATVLGSNPATISAGQILMTHSTTGYVIIHVIKTKKTSLAAATPQLKSELSQNQGQTLLITAAVTESKKLNVHVNPRYGTWDPQTQRITPIKSKISSPS
jgi:parvulin-like peptidyl-prolyl isomerase